MIPHDPITITNRGAFRQSQYLTLPLSVSSDYRTRVLRAALDSSIAAARKKGGRS